MRASRFALTSRFIRTPKNRASFSKSDSYSGRNVFLASRVRRRGSGPAEALTMRNNSRLALKNTTHFSGTETRAPVFGFLANLARRWRRPNIPNPRTSTRSPLWSDRTMPPKIAFIGRVTGRIRGALQAPTPYRLPRKLFARIARPSYEPLGSWWRNHAFRTTSRTDQRVCRRPRPRNIYCGIGKA